MKQNYSRFLSILLVFALLLTMAPISAFAEEAEDEGIIRSYGDYEFTKVSNPTSGSGEPDGINTNDLTGYEANRLNSYAWAVISRGEYIYIGTNRTLFGSALNAVIENNLSNAPLTYDQIVSAIDILSGGDMPVDLDEEDYIPQIIRVNVNDGTTQVIYQPATGRRESDGVLCYLNKAGEVVEAADVASETASFRSVVEFQGNLYFGSLGTNMISLVRVDENDEAQVVYQTQALVSSLRANCRYDDGSGETVYIGGFDTTYQPWRVYRYTHPEDTRTMPVVIRRLDPATAGTDNEDWSGIIADFRDFGKYAGALVYANGGGNVWDLVSYNGYIYLVLGYDSGWALFRGQHDADNAAANEFGWVWTEIVGDNSIYNYPLGMSEEVAELNAAYTEAYSATDYGANLHTAGLLESTATPYVFNGKMYIGSFDNATAVQSETVVKAVRKLSAMMGGEDTGPSLASIFGPIYQVLSHPQHIWVMDENENITAVESANELLDGTTNDYVWRFIEHEGKLYTGTFDAATAYTYFLDGPLSGLINAMQTSGAQSSDAFNSLMDDSCRQSLLTALDNASTKNLDAEYLMRLRIALDKALTVIRDFLNDEASVEALTEAIQQLYDVWHEECEAMSMYFQEIAEKVNYLLACFDLEGLRLWSAAKDLANGAQRGFDIFVTEDGENWEPIVRDGLNDPYNYGARTFTICQGELYVGTANPYYGAQLWRITPAACEHEYGRPEWTWAEDYSAATAAFTCLCGDDVQTLEAEVAAYTLLKPTLYTPGLMCCIARVEFQGETYESMRLVTIPNLEHLCPCAMFEDLPEYGTPEHEAIDWAYTEGITAGMDETHFGTGVTLTRAQAATFLYAAAGKPEFDETAADNSFSDVAADKWYTKAVLWAASEGLFSGYADGTFQPNTTLTRGQILVILYAQAGKPSVEGLENPYSDVAAGKWYTDAALWAYAEGIEQGENGLYAQETPCTREAMVLYLYRTMTGNCLLGADAE